MKKLNYFEKKRNSRESGANWRRNNKAYIARYSKQRSEKRKLFLRGKKKDGCANCGYKENLDILEFHHKKREPSNRTICSIHHGGKALEDELEKCQVLCPNCHALIHLKDKKYDSKGGRRELNKKLTGY